MTTDHSKTPSVSSLGRVAKRSVAAMMTGRGVVVLTNLGATVVLARLLEPEDFGIFGIAMLFTGLAQRFGNIGFGSALIQRKEIRDEHVSSLFTLNLLIYPPFTVLLVLASPLVGSFFDSPSAGRVLVVASLVFLTSPFSSVARALLRRRMEFKWIALAGIANHMIGAAVSIVLAWRGFGVWSLVYGRLTASLSSTIIMVARARWTPRLGFSRAAIRDLFSFGLKMFLKNLLIYGSNKVDYFIIAKRMGPVAFGLYEKAFNIMDLVVKQVGRKVAGGVLFSVFARLQSDRRALRAAYLKVVLALSLVCIPFFAGLFLVAPSLVNILFGEKWLPSVLPLQIMCVAGLMRMYTQVASTVVNAMGKVAAELRIRVAALVVLGLGCWYGSDWGIVGVAVAVAVTTCLVTLAMISYLGQITGLTWADFIRPQFPAFIGAVFMFGAVLIYQRSVENVVGTHSALMLFSSTAIGVVAYAAVLGIIRPRSAVSLMKGILMDLRPVAK